MTVQPEFSRPLAADRVGARGFDQTVAATEDECAALAVRLREPAVRSLTCAFHLSPGRDRARGEVVADGTLSAVLVRRCVVTLEEFETEVIEAFRVRFVADGTERETEIDEDDELPIVRGEIDLGETAAEQLALALDPFPRSPDAALPEEFGSGFVSLFAALGPLRTRH